MTRDNRYDRIRHLHNCAHRSDVMYPHHMGSACDAHRHSGSGGKLKTAPVRFRQEGLARRSHQEWHPQCLQLKQACKNLSVLFLPFTEAEPRVHHNPLPFNSSSPSAIDRSFQLRTDRFRYIVERSLLQPHVGRAASVIQDETCVGPGCDLRKVGLPRQTRRIVNDLGSVVESDLCHFRFIGIDADWNVELPPKLLQHGNQPAQLLRCRYPLGTGARRFSADVENIRAKLLQFKSSLSCRLRFRIRASIAERVWRHIQDTHDQRSFAKLNFAIANFPNIAFADHRVLLISEAGDRVEIRGAICGIIPEK